jgi:enterochelin esterase family protein
LPDVLAGQARELQYGEFDGGHDAACWAVSLPKALRASWQH